MAMVASKCLLDQISAQIGICFVLLIMQLETLVLGYKMCEEEREDL